MWRPSPTLAAWVAVLAFLHGPQLGYGQDCGGELSQKTGTITSPNYPQPYPDNEQCRWTITAGDDEVIDLRFSRLDLDGAESHIELGTTCPDYVNIYDGDHVQAPLLAKLCRSKTNEELSNTLLRSTGNTMLVEFISDRDGQKPGFLASYWMHECEEFMYGSDYCTNSCNCDRDNSVSCNNTDGTCNCKPGWTSEDCSVDIDECVDQTVEPCPDYQDCFNTMGNFTCQCKEGLQMNTAGNCEVIPSKNCASSSCSHTCVDLPGQGQVCYCPNNMKLEGSICVDCDNVSFGKECRLSCSSSCNVDNTQSCNTTGGCNCKDGWTSDDCSEDIDECDLQLDRCQEINKVCVNNVGSYDCVDCNFVLSGPSGIIQSPNFPNEYSNGLDCSWTITAAGDDETVTLEVSTFNKRLCSTYDQCTQQRRCTCDFLKIYDGANDKAELLGEYCHQSSLQLIRSSGKSMHIVYYAEQTNSYSLRGFNGTYLVQDDSSYHWNRTAETGSIMSSSYPNGQANEFSKWTITVESGKIVTFRMSDLDLGTTDCDKSHIVFYDGIIGSYSYKKVCGSNNLANISSTENVMTIVYFSDGSSSGRGFEGTYITDACKCYLGGISSCDSGPSGTCVCNDQFTGTDCCTDINECTDTTDPCPEHSTCYNYRGGYYCYCRNGTRVTSTDVCNECKSILTDESGIIQSPGYPSTYGYYISCSWTIVGQPGKVVSLRFSSFDVYAYYGCRGVVEIYDGSTSDSSLIGSYCGRNIPELIRTTQQSMHIVFRSPYHGYTAHGFQAAYSVHECQPFYYGLGDSCPTPCPCNNPHTKLCDNVNGICFCQRGWVGSGCSVKQDECRDENTCPSNSDCYNEPPGSYTCNCRPGYSMNDLTYQCDALTKCVLKCSHSCYTEKNEEICACPEDLILYHDLRTCRVPLYPYGKGADDITVDPSNSQSNGEKNINDIFRSEPIHFDAGVSFGDPGSCGSSGMKAYALLNGVVSFGSPDTIGEQGLGLISGQAILAPMWTGKNYQADKMYHQVYEKCDSSDFQEDESTPSPVKQEVLERAARDVMKYANIEEFEATSVMVVTWQKSQGSSTNTFQSVLVTGYELHDGQYKVNDSQVSFAIFIYDEGPAGWNFVRNQVIDIGISTGCGKPQKRDPKALFLFNQLPGTSDRGVFYFKLGSQASPEQKCQNYLCSYVDFVTNQNYQAEIDGLYQCPCSLDRLGLQWTRYTEAEDIDGHRCYVIRHLAKLRVLINNPRNKVCCYKWTEPQSKSKEDVFEALQASTYVGGHVLISDPWTAQGSMDVSENIEAGSWCCQESSKPVETCGRFDKVFPDMGCSKDPIMEPARIFGDPHFLTMDGVEYSMNGWGEYVMIDIATENFVLQARTGRVETSTGVLGNGTVFIAFAAQEGDYAHFQVELAASGASMVILANGMDFTESFYNNVDFTYSSATLGVIRVDGDNQITLVAVFPCGVAFRVSVGLKSLDIELEVDNRLQGKTQGLLGNFNGNLDDDFMLPNGTVLPNTLSERQILKQFAREYLVTDATSVFVYEGGETTEDYQHPEFTPLFLDEIDASQLAAARTVCGEGYDACIYDYLVTGNEEFARNTKEVLQATKDRKNYLRNSPPTLRVSQTAEINPWIVTAGTQSSLQFEATDDDGDDVTYELLGSTSGLSISQSGVLTYTANLQTPVTISVRAKDNNGGYSIIVTVRVAVCPVCNNQGQCSTSEAAAQVLNNGQFMILSCQCHPAYTGVYCDSELDGCASYPCMQGQTCVDLTAAQQGDNLVGYDCGPCPAGFTQVDDICVDVDECLDENVCDQNCTNTYGSYQCSCGPGYRLDLSDKTSCTDINECDEGRSGCEQICTNTEGGFDCSCTDLYTLNTDGKTCSPNFNPESPCQQCEHVCVEKNGEVACECKLGYRVDSNDPNKCIDIDECSSTNNPCNHNCINTDGEFECSCNEGYTLDMDGLLCVECESPYFGDNCSQICDCKGRGQCDPVRGCVCDAPWSGFSCDTRINRCEEPGACPPQFVCEEGIDSVLCLCPPGYTLDNGDCVDINECLDPGFSSSCDLNVEICINNQGNYSCTCKHGYFRNSQGICQDIDECEKQIDGCSHVCTNGPGGFKCSCHLGYVLSSDRRHCELRKDICGQSCSHGCVSDGSGGYTCVCPRGYSQTAQGTCQDVDECGSDSTNLCEYKDSCVNTDGGFTCSCQIGSKLDNDGRSCLACSGGTWGEECANVCACGIGASHCDPVLGCVCKFGFSGERCTESVDRCASGELTCQQHEECIYSAGSSYCQCQQGFEPTGSGCQDRNECLNVRLHNCDQVCINTVGGFTCSCLEGYTYDASTNTCTDVDECQQGSSECQHSCTNVDGGYRCSCPTDLILQPDYRTCAACREADVTTGECPSDCNCVESNTEYCNRTTRQCTCKQGWTSVDCSVDVDECLNDPCPDNRGCSNLDGSFECVCWNGLQFSSGGNCLDCNRTLTEASGRLMTSNYPQQYANNLYCTWTITVPESQAVISISFDNYDVEGCPYDSAAVYDGTSTAAQPLASLCGGSPPPVITSTGNSMHIVFTSDASVTDKGFRASYTSGVPCRENSCSHSCRVTSTNPWTQECFCPDWMDLDQADGQTCRDRNGCNTTISSSSGTLVSPQYPGEYPTNTYCYWILQGDVGSVVTLSFSVFAMEGSVDCPYDYLEMRDGNNPNAPVLQRSCGGDLPSSVTTTGSAMYIIFRSDDSITNSGFVSEFSVH